MFFEYVNEVVTVYYTFSVLLSIFGTYTYFGFVKNDFLKRYYLISHKRNLVLSSPVKSEKTNQFFDPIQAWITRKQKRKEAPEDDGEYYSFSTTKRVFENRGGLICHLNLYSPLLGKERV